MLKMNYKNTVVSTATPGYRYNNNGKSEKNPDPFPSLPTCLSAKMGNWVFAVTDFANISHASKNIAQR